MSERTVALSCSAYQKLREYYYDRDKAAKDWKTRGGRVALVMGSDVPEEILYAAGYLPVSVYSDYVEPTNTELYLEESCDHDLWTRGVIKKLTDGTYKQLAERLVISYSTLRMYNLFNVLREVRRQMPDAPVPYVEFLDTDYSKTLLAQKHNHAVYAKFRRDIEAWICQEITDAQIQAAIDIYNDDRSAMREFDLLRRGATPRVTGTEALVVIGSSLFMDRKEHAKLVWELISEARDWPEVEGTRVFITGSDHDTPELYMMIESLGGVVVMEDHNFGARHYESDVTFRRDPVKGLADRYIYRMPTGKVNICERVEVMKKCVSESVPDAVIMYLKVNDIGASWEYPSIRQMLDGENIPIIRFYDQETPMANAQEIEVAVANLINNSKGGK